MAKVEPNSLFTAVSEEESSTVSGGDGGTITGPGVSLVVDGLNIVTDVIGPDGSQIPVTNSSTSGTTGSTSGTGTTFVSSVISGVPGTGLN